MCWSDNTGTCDDGCCDEDIITVSITGNELYCDTPMLLYMFTLYQLRVATIPTTLATLATYINTSIFLITNRYLWRE